MKNDIRTIKIDLETFKDYFINCFYFKQVKRPSVDSLVSVHFKVYKILYENIYSVCEYAEFAIEEEEKQEYGMILKKKQNAKTKCNNTDPAR